MIIKRKIYNELLKWKETSNGKYALLIEGARRVGKSTIVEQFAKNEYSSYIIIDFYKAPAEVVKLFDDLSDLNYIFLQLQLRYNVSLEKRKSLIVFDEVQLCPRARQAIKALVKDGRYDYIETGSLISIYRNVKDILIPSEEHKITMFPMDFEEFRWALGDDVSVNLIREFYDKSAPLGFAHRKVLRDFRLYMLVGGMPQAVEAYIDSNNFSVVDRVKRTILELYESDFRKIDPDGKLSKLFNAIPAQLSRSASRFQVSSVLENARSSGVLKQLSILEDSKTVLMSYSVNDPNVGLSQSFSLEKFKIFTADTGLFVTLAFQDKSFVENDLYEKLLSDKLRANLGYLYENVIAQTLATNGHRLFYHTFLNKASGHNYEIDFVISDRNKICPIEVKSSTYKKHTSIDRFTEKYSSRISKRYVLHTKDYKRVGDTIYLPVYMTQFL